MSRNLRWILGAGAAAVAAIAISLMMTSKSPEEKKLDKCNLAADNVEMRLADLEGDESKIMNTLKVLTVDCDYILEVLDALDFRGDEALKSRRKLLVKRLLELAEAVEMERERRSPVHEEKLPTNSQ